MCRLERPALDQRVITVALTESFVYFLERPAASLISFNIVPNFCMPSGRFSYQMLLEGRPLSFWVLDSLLAAGFWQELHASPHIEHTTIFSYPYISIYGYVLSIYGYVG